MSFLVKMSEQSCTIDDKDFIKFIIMGWYIYNLISSNEEIPDELPESPVEIP